MSPVSVAGTTIQLNAEALAGIAFVQMINPGTPCIFGSFQTNIDLQSGAPVFGSPEAQIALYTTAQLARRHGLPFRSGGMFAASKIPDAQAAYESVMSMMPAVLARTNFVLHAAGWLEGGLAAGYEKFVMDVELLGMFHTFLKGLDLSENGLAMESLRNTHVDDHHLGTPHTMANFRTAFFRSNFFNYDSYEKWVEEGSESTYTRANREYKKILKAYESPDLDPALDEQLQAYMAKRKTEIKPEY
jgi:trimethylamine--corrinoid protein Co-methyltransferase